MGDGPQGKCDGVIRDAGAAANLLCRVACAARISRSFFIRLSGMVVWLKDFIIADDGRWRADNR